MNRLFLTTCCLPLALVACGGSSTTTDASVDQHVSAADAAVADMSVVVLADMTAVADEACVAEQPAATLVEAPCPSSLSGYNLCFSDQPMFI